MAQLPGSFNNKEQVLAWYKQNKWFHERLAQLVSHYLESQVKLFFSRATLPVVAKVSYREKKLASLSRTLSTNGYGKFPMERERINDLAGVRVVFYFADDVQAFWNQGELLFRSWFGIDANDRRESNDGIRSDNWGRSSKWYRGRQFTLKVSPDSDFYRALTSMDQRFLRGLCCEVQLRTTLQDAWAEASHDIRYKARGAKDTERDAIANHTFNVLADQLKVGDDTLVSLKADYKTNVERSPSARHASPSTDRPWKYRQPQFTNSAIIHGVLYPYELLDQASSSLEPLNIDSSTTVFNVDEAFWKAVEVRNYKDTMWQKLQETEAQFVVSIAYDSMVVRVTHWNAASRTLSVELAAYSDQVVTNHKRAHGKTIVGDPLRRTVEELAADGERLLPFEQSPLSNTLGVCCVLRTVDDRWPVALRSPSVAFDPGTWGCPASGALNWVELGHWESRDFNGWFKTAIVREIEEELGFTVDPDQVLYLGLGREFGRLGKPQVFFYVDAAIKCDDLSAKFTTYKKVDSEFQRLEFLTDAKAADLVSADEGKVNRLCEGSNVSEELRFNLALALEMRKSGSFKN